MQSLIHVTSLPEKEGFLYQRVGGLFKRGVNISVNSKTSNLPPGIPQVHVFDWSFALCGLWKQPFFLAPCRCMETFLGEELLQPSDKKFHNDDVKSVWNQVRSADWSMEKLHCLSYCLWMTDKINTKGHKECQCHEYKQNSQYLWNIIILLQKKHLSFSEACLQMYTTILIKLTKRNIQLNKINLFFCLWNPMTTRFIT